MWLGSSMAIVANQIITQAATMISDATTISNTMGKTPPTDLPAPGVVCTRDPRSIRTDREQARRQRQADRIARNIVRRSKQQSPEEYEKIRSVFDQK